ncbi:RmlC-like cupin [Glarea lozoyensis ATCC 20868]|uniref:Cysteine dioxygenase n=1 Tax=Glarea lozoyensis (strain ATCC 20868 / MF5171) TaxID=1116229 RepID=S3CQH9_GLAL2|nr:RmlC-like cupin [Glarea lozoyensis ATCC 20868]EPE27364.1 RmlC-like cupin [Glarea lozoyensis ATCC 20868]
MSPLKLATRPFLRSQPLISKIPRVFTTTDRSATITGSARTAQLLPTKVDDLSLSPSNFPLYRGNSRFQMLKPAPRVLQNSFSNLQNALVQHLAAHPPSSLSPTLPKLFSLLRGYTSDRQHWSRFAHANINKQYTRNLVCEVPGLFNLLILVWTPGKKSPVHDHADSHCLMKILQGKLIESRFKIPTKPGLDGPLCCTSRKDFERDQVTYMSDSLGLHEISNPSSTEFAVSMHLYTPPNAAIRGCHVYDMDNGEAKHVMQGAYDSVNGWVS